MTRIVVLEDDPRRIESFRVGVRSLPQGFELHLFSTAPKMIEWISANLVAADILSLDRDLDLTMPQDNDCGTGEDVTDFLVRQSVRPAILLHSSNALRAPAMHMELTLAGFPIVLLCPFLSGIEWASDISSARSKYKTIQCQN